MDIRLALMNGSDIPVPECQIALHQPTLEEIGMMGEEDFFIGVQTLCVTTDLIRMDETLPSTITNFQIFMTVIKEKQMADKKAMVQSVLSIMLPKNKITFTPTSMLIMGGDENIIIDDNNFDKLQDAVKQIFCLTSKASQNFNPANEDAKKIAEKLARGRQRIAQEKGGTGSVLAQYESSLSIGLHIPITEFRKYTLYQLYDQIERFGLYLDWDIDIKSRLAGATPNKPPENWMKDIH